MRARRGAAALAAAADHGAIGAVVSDSAFASFRAVARRRFESLLPWRMGVVLLPGTLFFARLFTGANLARFEPGAHARSLYSCRVLVIHAQGDTLIPVSDAHAIAASSCGGMLWTTPEGDHVGSFETDPLEYERRVCSFFAWTLATRRAPVHGGERRCA